MRPALYWWPSFLPEETGQKRWTVLHCGEDWDRSHCCEGVLTSRQGARQQSYQMSTIVSSWELLYGNRRTTTKWVDQFMQEEAVPAVDTEGRGGTDRWAWGWPWSGIWACTYAALFPLWLRSHLWVPALCDHSPGLSVVPTLPMVARGRAQRKEDV